MNSRVSRELTRRERTGAVRVIRETVSGMGLVFFERRVHPRRILRRWWPKIKPEERGGKTPRDAERGRSPVIIDNATPGLTNNSLTVH